MKVVEILVNGRRRAVVGNAVADTVDLSLIIHSSTELSLVSHAITESETGEPICEYWPELSLAESDRIEIRLIELEEHTKIDPSHPGTHRRVSDGSLQPACSMCGKTAEEVDQIIAGQTGNICNECVEFCSDLIVSKKNSNGAEA